MSLETRYVVQPYIYRLKISILWLFRKSSERDRRARHERVSRRKTEATPCWGDYHGWGLHWRFFRQNSWHYLTGPSTPTRYSARSNRTYSQETRGQSFFLVNQLVCRACNSSSAIDADRQDDFYSLMTAVRSFYDAYPSKITVDDSWEDRLSAVCYQPETIRSRGRPRFVITGRQLDALQERQYSWRSMARTLRASYRTILRRRRELGMAIGERFSRVSEMELDEIVSNILLRTPDGDKSVDKPTRLLQFADE